MSDFLNLNNVAVDDSGRVTISGLSSGIDIHGTVDAIIAARRIPVDNLEIVALATSRTSRACWPRIQTWAGGAFGNACGISRKRWNRRTWSTTWSGF